MHVFDRDTALTKQNEGLYRATITSNWTVNGNANGGYLMALATHAMIQHTEKKGPPIITATFISRTEPGEAELRVDQISCSKQFDRYQCSLVQKGKERIRVSGTFSLEDDRQGEKRYERSEPCVAQPYECVPMPEIPNYTLYSNMDVRFDPSCAGWLSGNLSDTSELRGWMRFKEERPFDLLAAVIMADAFPPAVLASHGMRDWIPTIELSVNIRNYPPTSWLKCVFRTSFIQNGILEEDGELWDERGDLVGIARQYAQIRRLRG